MKKQLFAIAVLVSITSIAFAQRPVFTNHRSYYGNRGYHYPNQAFTPVRPGGFDYNPPYANTGNYQYRSYSSVDYIQQYGRQYGRRYQGRYQQNYGYQNGYLNNCFPYLNNDLRYQKSQMIIGGAVQIIRGITLPNYSPYSYGDYYGNNYYGNSYYQYQNYGAGYYNTGYYNNAYYNTGPYYGSY